jgi:dephospho-CoA kinase
MLRVGLTGGLGSGKSAVSAIFSELGAAVLSADEVARRLMQPGEEVYAAIVRQFGGGVVQPDGALDRGRLARLAFEQHQGPALNRIVHPATVAAEEEWMAALRKQNPAAIAIVESALIFEVEKWGTAPGWVSHFDRIILVTAPEQLKLERVIARAIRASGGDESRRAILERDARARMALQIPDRDKLDRCDFVIANHGSLAEMRSQVESIYARLLAENVGYP